MVLRSRYDIKTIDTVVRGAAARIERGLRGVEAAHHGSEQQRTTKRDERAPGATFR